MARPIHRLSARAVTSAKERGLHADGGGLFLQVARNGSRSWLFRFTLRGKTRHMGLGPIDSSAWRKRAPQRLNAVAYVSTEKTRLSSARLVVPRKG